MHIWNYKAIGWAHNGSLWNEHLNTLATQVFPLISPCLWLQGVGTIVIGMSFFLFLLHVNQCIFGIFNLSFHPNIIEILAKLYVKPIKILSSSMQSQSKHLSPYLASNRYNLGKIFMQIINIKLMDDLMSTFR